MSIEVLLTRLKAEILEHTIQLCGMTKGLRSKHVGALVNAVQPLVICKYPGSVDLRN